jgi:hypothetical protein
MASLRLPGKSTHLRVITGSTPRRRRTAFTSFTNRMVKPKRLGKRPDLHAHRVVAGRLRNGPVTEPLPELNAAVATAAAQGRTNLAISLPHASRVVSKKTQAPSERGFPEADDGTRTHDLLHGKSQRCSRPFAPVRSNRFVARPSPERANAREPERTPNLAILATLPAEPSMPEITDHDLGWRVESRCSGHFTRRSFSPHLEGRSERNEALELLELSRYPRGGCAGRTSARRR